MTLTATVDRDTKYHALLVINQTGAVFDVYGDTVAELKADADCIAEGLGVKIEVYNWELPE